MKNNGDNAPSTVGNKQTNAEDDGALGTIKVENSEKLLMAKLKTQLRMLATKIISY